MVDLLAVALSYSTIFLHLRARRITHGALFLLLWLGVVGRVFLGVVALTSHS